MLEYGFGRHAQTEKAQAYWKAKFDALNETDKKFFHGELSWAMMIAGFGHISAGTIPDIARRLLDRHIFNDKDMGELVKEMGTKNAQDALEVYLCRFVGFEVNVCSETPKEWVNRQYNNFMKYESKLKTRKDLEKERRDYQKWKAEVEGGM